jgi:hypothetical protein
MKKLVILWTSFSVSPDIIQIGSQVALTKVAIKKKYYSKTIGDNDEKNDVYGNVGNFGNRLTELCGFKTNVL